MSPIEESLHRVATSLVVIPTGKPASRTAMHGIDAVIAVMVEADCNGCLWWCWYWCLGFGAAVAVTNFGTRVLNSFEELDRDKFLENYHKSVASSSISCAVPSMHAGLLSHCWVLLVCVCVCVRVCRRPKKRGLVTIANHVSILDDPFVVGTYDTACTATTTTTTTCRSLRQWPTRGCSHNDTPHGTPPFVNTAFCHSLSF